MIDKPVSFAAFVMTFKRNQALEETILSLFKQSVKPSKVLIVDNDPNKGAMAVLNTLNHLPVSYHAVGYNSGPAGAAKAGLQILCSEGFDWVAWIDDDDPPFFEDNFEILLNCATSTPNCGCVGAVGQRYNPSKAIMIRVPDEELLRAGIIEVDNVAGNMCKLINSQVVKESGVLPDESLFFGYEELDFDLRIKKAGYRIIADAELYKRYRTKANRLGFKTKRGLKKTPQKLWRDYYSARNLLVITKKQKQYFSIFLLIFRFGFKSMIGFRFGFTYGFKNFKCNMLALFHFFGRKSGKTILSI